MTECVVVEAGLAGLAVAAARMPWAHAAAGGLYLHAGFADDPPGRAGLAHLTEHVCVATAARRFGVHLAARTDAAGTRYSAHAPGSAELVPALLSPLLADPYPAALHEAETQAVLTENARLADQPELGIAATVAAQAFPALDVGVRDTTTGASLAAVTQNDVAAFRRTRYRPARAALCVVGPEDPEVVVDRVGRSLAVLSTVDGARPPEAAGPAAGATGAPGPAGAAGWPDRLIWSAVTPAVRTQDDLVARQVAVDLLVGSPGLLDRYAAWCGARPAGFSAIPGRRQAALVVAFSGPALEPLAELLSRAAELPAPPDLIGAVRHRVATRLAFEQQSPGGLARQLLGYAAGNGPWPEVAAVEVASGERVADLVAAILRTGALWRVDDGLLSQEER